MRPNLLIPALALLACTPRAFAAATPAEGAQPPAVQQAVSSAVKASAAKNVVRVNVTAQAYDFSRPWSKRAPTARKAIGAVLKGGRVLVTAECVANANYIELESPDGDRKEPASVVCVDYEANIALLRPESAGFLSENSGLDLASPRIGDNLSVLQLEPNGNPLISKGDVTTAEVTRYPIDDSTFLVCRMSVPLQIRDTTLSLPVFKGGSLAGLLLRYDAQASLLDFIPASILEHFLKDVERGPYEGFPRMGCVFSVTRDPQLRRYLGLQGAKGGVLISQTLRGGPSDKAGLQKGDVLMEIQGIAIDSDGNYQDPDYGRISLGYLVNTKHFEGEKLRVRLLRDGKPLEKEVPVARRHPHEYLSPPYIIDTPPEYYVVGGLVFQELSRQFLKEFGADWSRKAPLELVQIDRTQSEISEDSRKHVVVLTRVLPSDVTIGYEDLRNNIVTAINGVTLGSLQDVPKSLLKAENGLHRIELKGDPSLLFIDAKAAEAVGPGLQKSYGLPSLSRLTP